MKRVFFFLGILFALAGCNKSAVDPWVSDPQDSAYAPFEADYDINDLSFYEGFESPSQFVGKVEFPEISGMVSGISNPDYLWIHEDSGNPADFSLIRKSSAEAVVSYHLQGVDNIDWEDMAIGPGPVDGESYLYIGETGDNDALRSNCSIYRLKEPVYYPADSGKTIEISAFEKLAFVYPDGPRDAETLLLDPETKDLYILTKREKRVRLYRAAFPQSASLTNTLEYMGSFPFNYTTGGDVSADGSRVLLCTYAECYFWKKDGSESFISMMAKAPQRVKYDPQQLQTEAVCWDDHSFFVTSEKVSGYDPKLYRYQAK